MKAIICMYAVFIFAFNYLFKLACLKTSYFLVKDITTVEKRILFMIINID